MSEQKPIDKTKRSNRRCVNCVHWGSKKQSTGGMWDPSYYCSVGHKGIEYWNCCKKFEWNPNKLYKQEAKHE